MVLWQLVQLGTLMYVYTLLAFKKPKSAQVTTGATSIKYGRMWAQETHGMLKSRQIWMGITYALP